MSEEERIVLVFDVGTQSSRALLINQFGNILAKSQKKYEHPYFSNHIDYAEQDADFYYQKICEASMELSQAYPLLFQKIEAISLTTIRDTVVCVDSEGKPLRPAILWLDKRRAKGKPHLPNVTKALLKTVGMEKAVKIQYSKSHCNWIREEEPEIWKKTDKFLLLSGYLNYKITGEMKDAVASLVGHIPFDYKQRKWQSNDALTRPVFPVERKKLCKVVDTGDIIGYVTHQMSLDSGLKEGLPLIATGSDKACEILGMGCITKEKAAIGLGTTATITFMYNRYLEPERFIPPYPAVIKNAYNPEIEIFRGYWLVSWFKKEFALKEVMQANKDGISCEEILNRHLNEVPAGCNGLLFQPYFTPNITMPTARGAMIGFSDQHTRIHIYRSIIEGINFALMDGMRILEKRANFRFKEIYLGGGGSQSDEICQITANMFGLPVYRTQTHEVTGMGSAIATFVALKVFDSYEEAVHQMVHIKDCFEPNFKEQRIYHELYTQVYKNIYKKLSPLYQELHDIYHKAPIHE